MVNPVRGVVQGGTRRNMHSPRSLKFAALALLLATSVVFAISCGGSKANVRKDETAAAPAVVEVTTAAAIVREVPGFFEATGSLAGDQQTDVAPQTSGKVVALGVDIGSYVKRGQMLVKLDDAELKLRVDQALAQVEQAKAGLRQAEEKARSASCNASPAMNAHRSPGRRRSTGFR